MILFSVRRNLILDQPGLENNPGVLDKTISLYNPPDQDYLFGKAVLTNLDQDHSKPDSPPVRRSASSMKKTRHDSSSSGSSSSNSKMRKITSTGQKKYAGQATRFARNLGNFYKQD